MRTLAAAACSALVMAVGGRARAEPVDVVPFASIDVSRFSDVPTGYSELELGPGAVRDDEPATAWRAPGEQGTTSSIAFDWSSLGVTPFVVESLRVDVDPADAAIDVRTGPDSGSLAPAGVAISRDAAGATITLLARAPLRALEITVPAGTKVSRVSAMAVPGGTLEGAVTATCDGDGVHLKLPTTGAIGVRVTRVLSSSGAVELTRRGASGGVVTDASVRFDGRPTTYSYTASVVGSDAPPAQISTRCEGPPLQRPTPGALHGVVEGFYGRPWTWHEREKIVVALAALGLDTYVYAPKDDPLHRDRWRDPYDDETLAHFAKLSSLGRGLGVNVVYGISPGQDIDPSKPADVDALIGKISRLATAAGIRDAALLMDDLDATAHPHSRTLGQAHAALAAALLASMRTRDPASRLLFVPTVYSGRAASLAQGDVDYLGALTVLPMDVPIAWTGPGVFSQSLSLADAAAFGGLAGRGAQSVWIWDNYPANDVAVFRRLFTRPITGRESILPSSGGLVSNPMRHALASIPAIASYAELAIDPASYADARRRAAPLSTARLDLVLADGDAPPRALADFFDELVQNDAIWPNDLASPGLVSAISAYVASPPAASRRAPATDLAARLARLALLDLELRRELSDQALADEIDAHARATSAIARAALDAMTGDRAERLGDARSAATARRRAACGWLAASAPTWTTIQPALASMSPTADTAACGDGADALAGPEPVLAAIGRPWTAALVDAQAEPNASWSVVDSEGAMVDPDGTLRWTPSRLGRFRIVALRIGDAGAAARAIDVMVVEALPPAPLRITGACAEGHGAGAQNEAPAIAATAACFALVVLRRRAVRRRSA